MSTKDLSAQNTERSEEILTSSLQSVTGGPSIDALSKAAERALDQILSRAAAEKASKKEPNGEKRLFFPDGIELIDVEFVVAIEPTKPNVTVKIHVRGPNAKPGIVQEISTQGMEIGNA